MDSQLAKWKFELERIWSAEAPDYGEAMRLAAQMANASEPATGTPTTWSRTPRGVASASFAKLCTH